MESKSEKKPRSPVKKTQKSRNVAEENVEKRIKSRSKTQRKLRKEKISEERELDELTKLTKKLEKVNLGKTVEILAAIWGHGGQCTIENNPKNNPFFEVRKNVQTNILGLGFSGVCSIGNTENNASIDNNLRIDPTRVQAVQLSKVMLEITKGYVEHRKEATAPILVPKDITEEKELYSYITDYGKDKKRCNKIYGPYKEGDPFVPGQLKNGKLLVRIYAIKTQELLNIPMPHDLYFKDDITLNEIIDAITEQTELMLKKTSQFDNIEKAVIHLFDSTCNYTGYNVPNIAFTDTAKQRTTKGVVKTTAYEQNLLKKQKDLELQRALLSQKTEPMEIESVSSSVVAESKSRKSSSKRSRSNQSKSNKSSNKIHSV